MVVISTKTLIIFSIKVYVGSVIFSCSAKGI